MFEKANMRMQGIVPYGEAEAQPKKKGFFSSKKAKERLSKAKSWVGKKVGEYQEYQKKAPERQKGRIQNLKLKVQEAKLKNQLRKQSPSPAYNFGGFAGPTTKSPIQTTGVADYIMGSSPRGHKGPSMSYDMGLVGRSRGKQPKLRL